MTHPFFQSDFKGLSSDPKQMVFVLLLKNYTMHTHDHNFYEVNVILSGHGTHCIQGHPLSVKKGDVFVIPPNISHSYENVHDLDVYHICIRPQFLQEHAGEASLVKGYNLLMEIEPFLRSNFDNSFFLSLNNAQLELLKQDLDLICQHPASSSFACLPLCHATALKDLYWMSQLLHRQLHQENPVINETQQLIVKSLEFIHQNYQQKLDLSLLCQHANTSRPTFMRKFKEVCGCSPIQYLMNYRRQQAEKLLSEGSLSKTQVAYECGFYDLSHMEKYLKK